MPLRITGRGVTPQGDAAEQLTVEEPLCMVARRLDRDPPREDGWLLSGWLV